MIDTKTGLATPYSVNFGPVYAGLTTIVYRLVNPDGSTTPAPAQDWALAAPLVDLGGGIYTTTLTITVPWTGNIEWDTALNAGNVETEEVLVSGTAVTTDYLATVDEVGALLRARTRDSSSVELGTFTADTRPTADDVTGILYDVAGKLQSRLGDAVPNALSAAARELVALRAALMVELTFFGDQIQAGRSPYNELKALYDQTWLEFLDARRDLGPDLLAGTDDDTSPSGLPAYVFTDYNQPWHVPGTELPYPVVTAGPWW